MELTHGVDQHGARPTSSGSRRRSTRAWQVLTDLERIAPCMPGAQLQEVEGDEYRGIVKVKVGPITAQYKGVARIVAVTARRRRLVLRAEGRETRGQGNANALITANLGADGDGTDVTINTDLTVTGKVAQFGRGVLADVSAKLLTSSSRASRPTCSRAERPRPSPRPPRRRRRAAPAVVGAHQRRDRRRSVASSRAPPPPSTSWAPPAHPWPSASRPSWRCCSSPCG